MGELPEGLPPEDSPPTPPLSITPSLMSLTIGEDLPNKLRLSCFHGAGAESIRTELGKPIEREIMAFYKEAISRLPVANMPELVDCVLTGGHCIGLLDPVSNIIFNALNLLCRRMCSGDSAWPGSGRKKRDGKQVPSTRKGAGKEESDYRWITIVFRSYAGLIAFMQTYFRYLSTGQASRYLRLAGADLAVAVQLGEHQQFGPEVGQTPDLCCGRTQYALKAAAAKADHPEPNDLAQLAKSLTPFKDQKPLAAVLQKGQLLSIDDVNGILSCLQRLHYRASPPVQVSFKRRPHPDFDPDFGLPGQQPSQFSCAIDENYIANVVITSYDEPVSSICNLRTSNEMKQMLFNCLDTAATTIGNCCPPHKTADPATAPPSTTCECEHISYLKTCLVDTIHAFYIKALSLLPHKPLHKHLRGILVAGHCYGPLDPVSNIILNAFWYDTHFPLLEMDAEVEPDIMDSKSMLRMEVRSLDSLVAMFCTATGLPEHNAVEYLCQKQCDLSMVLQMASKEIRFKAYDHAGQAGKHPKHSELASFLVSIYGNDVQGLRTSLTNEAKTKGYVISDASLELLNKVVGAGGLSSLTAPSGDRPRLSPVGWKMLASRKGDFVQKQGLLRKILEELLLEYSNQHPWEPMHTLDIICGVKENNYEHSKCYHLNFLAYCDDTSSNATGTTRVLFFAEVWGSRSKAKPSELDTSVKLVSVPCTGNGHRPDSNSHAKIYCKSGQVKSRTSFCCPLPYYNVEHPYLGRCAICEPSSSKIAHPPSGNHAGANCSEIGASVAYLNFVELASVVDCVTNSDFMYFDCLRDIKFAEIVNGKPTSEMKQPIIS